MNQDLTFISSLYGGFWRFGLKDFCYLVNPYFPPNRFMESLKSNLPELINSYPSTNWYISALLGDAIGLTHDELVIGNGASELISSITRKYVRNIAVPVPSFDEYINRSVNQGKQVSSYNLTGDFGLDIDGYIQYIQKSDADSALIINPNNPTGTLVSPKGIYDFLHAVRNLELVIIDESFLEFSDPKSGSSAIDVLSEFPNLIVLKSLSKAWGIPGLRLGYAASANGDMIRDIRSDVPIWSINSFAQFFLENINDFQAELLESCNRVRIATDVLFKGLETVPYLRPYPTEANFVFCKVVDKFNSRELTATLLERFGVLINDCGGKHGLDQTFVRIASRTEKENRELVEILLSIC